MTLGASNSQGQSITACHDCNLLLSDKRVLTHRKASCPRCGATLHITRTNSMERTLAISIAGLLLFIPANTLPIMTLEILGQSNTNTMVNGIVQMTAGGYWWMSLLVCFCSILAPLAKLLMLAFISAGSLMNGSKRGVANALKIYHHLDEWGMFDVYMLGILISFIKMKDMGTLIPGLGLLSFVSLLLLATACSSVFDSQQAWARLGAGFDDEDARPESSSDGLETKRKDAQGG